MCRQFKKVLEMALNKKTQRRWTESEVESILEFIKNTVKSGKGIEKPTADKYYARILASINLTDCSLAQIKGKIRHLKKKYISTIQWRNQTGQGVLEKEGECTFKAATISKCPYFDDLDEIYGSKLNIFPPVVLQTAGAPSHIDKTNTVDNELPEIPVCNFEIQENSNVTENSDDVVNNTATKYVEEDEAQADEAIATNCSKDDDETAAKKLKTCRGDRSTTSIKDKGSLAALIECRRQKTDAETKKLSLEKEKFGFEKEKLSDDLKMKNRELDIKEKELDLQQIRMESGTEIDKYELELKYKQAL